LALHNFNDLASDTSNIWESIFTLNKGKFEKSYKFFKNQYIN